MKKNFFLRFLSLLMLLLSGTGMASAESETLASWTFTSSHIPSDKANFSADAGSWKDGSTFNLNGSGSTWNTNKPDYAFTAVTDITITLKLGVNVAAGTELTLSVDAYYNKASNAPAKGYNLTVSANGGAFSTAGLSTTSWSLGTSKATLTTVYTTQTALSAGATIAFKLTQTGKAGSGQAFINNISVSGDVSSTGDGGDTGGGETGGGETGGEVTTVTGTFTKVISGTIGAGTYIFVGAGNNAALINNTIASNWIKGTETTFTENAITNPSSAIVWTVTDDGKIKPYGSSKYLYASAAKKIALDDTASTTWSFSYSSGSWDISGKTGNTGIGNLQYNSDNSGWRPYTSSTGTAGFQIYKLSVALEPEAPAITNQLADAVYTKNATATALTVVATGYPAPTYQWFANSVNNTSGATAIVGATSASYTPDTSTVSVTYYYCVATNSAGSATSNIASVSVTPVSYTLTYDANGGEGAPAAVSAEDGTQITLAGGDGMTREGYTFTGWNTEANGSGESHDAGTSFTITGTTTLYAQWSKNPFTVNLNAGAGTCGVTSLTETTGGAGVTLPAATIAITGWSFAGWSPSAVSETTTTPTLISAGKYVPESNNITLYAVYSKTVESGGNEYAVTTELTPGEYVLGAVKSAASKTLANNTTIGAITFSSMESWGSYVDITPDENGVISTTNADAIWTLSGNATSGYVLKKGSLYFYLTTGTKASTAGTDTSEQKFYVEDASNTCKDAFLLHPTSSSTNKLLLNNDSGYRMYGTTTTITDSMFPYIRFYKKSGATTYNTNPQAEAIVDVTGVTLSKQTLALTVGETATLTATVAPDNATNKNVTWDTSDATIATVENGVVTAVKKGSATITVTTADQGKTDTCVVTVNAVSYTLTYDANGGENAPAAVSAEDGTQITLANGDGMTREGYTFAGWNSVANGSGESHDAGTAFTITGTTTLYAQWSINSYTVTWKVNGNNWGEATTVEYGQKPALPAAPASSDFDGEKQFMGWTIEANVDSDDAPSDIFTTSSAAPEITDDATFHAVFASSSSSAPTVAETVSFESSEGYTGNSTYNSATYKTGTNGSKWAINYGDFSAAGATHGSQNAEFRIYASNGGWGQLRNTVAYEGNISAVSFYGYAGNKAGKVTVSYSANGLSWTDIETIDLTTDDTLYSLNIPGEAHYIRFTAEGTRPNSKNYGIYIDDVTITTGATTYSGYVTSTGGKTLSSISVDASDARKEYAIGDKLDVSGVVVTANYSDGTSRPVTSGFTFSPADRSVLTEGGEQTVTVNYGGKSATYTINVKCRLAYDANGGEGEMEGVLVDKGATATVAANSFTREHYTFTEWNTAADGSGDTYAAGATITVNGNVTLYAQWTVNRYTVTYDANGGEGTMTDDDSPYAANAWVSVLPNTFTRTGYRFASWDTEADGSGETYANNDSFKITADVTLYAQWEARGEEAEVIFHEGFGSNPNSAREWSDSYKEQSGVAAVYTNAVYTITNAKQSKNTVGSVASGLMQSTNGSDASFEVGPLNLSAYADGTDVTLSYKWKATSTSKNYSTSVYYKAVASDPYTEIPNTAEGATKFVDVKVAVPNDALTSTAYFKVVFNTSNTQAIIDEFDLSGKQSKATPNAYFDLPVHHVYAYGDIDLPEHVSVSTGEVTHVSADTTVASIADGKLSGGATHGTSTIVTATIAETDDHASATASYEVKVVPQTVSIHPKAKITPFSSAYHLDFSAVNGITAYIVNETAIAANTGEMCFVVEEAAGQKVRAKEGMIIIVDTPNVDYEVPVLLDASPNERPNYLVGALKGTAIPYSDVEFTRFAFDNDDRTYIRLAIPSAVAGMEKASGKTIEATEDTAYIEMPATKAASLPDYLQIGVREDGGIVTGVENVTLDNAEDAPMYNILGIPVDDTYQGVIIRRGEKRLNR